MTTNPLFPAASNFAVPAERASNTVTSTYADLRGACEPCAEHLVSSRWDTQHATMMSPTLTSPPAISATPQATTGRCQPQWPREPIIEPDLDLDLSTSNSGHTTGDYGPLSAAVATGAVSSAGTDNAPDLTKCAYTASGGMSCRRAPTAGSAHCRSHSCPAQGCTASKSSRKPFCLQHDMGVETPYAALGPDAVLYSPPAPEARSAGIRRDNPNRRKPSQYNGFCAGAAPGTLESGYEVPESTYAQVDYSQVGVRPPPAGDADSSVYDEAVEMRVVDGAGGPAVLARPGGGGYVVEAHRPTMAPGTYAVSDPGPPAAYDAAGSTTA